MILNLYNVQEDNNVINKTLSNPYQITIQPRKDFDLIDPVFILKGDFSDYNYCSLPELNRYYFINQIENINSELVSLMCSTDLLETYKSQILASNAVFMRKIQQGDYIDSNIEKSVNKTITKIMGSVDVTDQSTLVLSTIGE